MSKKGKTRFIRKGGRIIPIRVKDEISVAKEISSKKNRSSLVQASVAGSSYLAGLYGAGRLHKKAIEVGSSKLNRVAKIGKFGIAFGSAAILGNALSKIDKRSSDEKSRVLSIGSQAKTGLGHVASFAAAYAGYRLGKRFEYAGKLGKNLFKIKDIKSMKKLKAL